MSKLVCVADMSSASAIVAAFQEAVDTVFNSEVITSIASDAYHRQGYQHVYQRSDRPAIGCASVVLSWNDSGRSAVFVTVFTSGRVGGPQPQYVPERLVRRLILSLDGTDVRSEFPHDPLNHEYRAALLAPTSVFRQYPHATLVMR